MTELEIETLQSQQRPDTDVYPPDSGNCVMAYRHGLYSRTNFAFERGSQQWRGHACDQSGGDRS